jgi:hypothetical protein
MANLYAHVVNRLRPSKLESLPSTAIIASSAAWLAISSRRSLPTPDRADRIRQT